MFLELIAAFVAGLGAAGVVLLLNRATAGRLPRWAMPVTAGAAMIGMAIALEMTWAARTAENLPDGIAVAETVSESAWWRPWTYVWPQTTRMLAVDTANVRTNAAAPDTRLVDIYVLGRWQPTRHVPQLIDCAAGTRADVTDAALADADAATWQPLPETSDLVLLTCAE